MLTLFHNDMSVCAQKVRMVLDHKKVDWHSEHLNLRAGDQFKPQFLQLNPKAVVPVLQHNDSVISESNAIIEYLEEVFSQQPLMPESSVLRASVRNWLIRLDAGLHENVAVISFCMAFRFQLLERYPTQHEMDAFIDNIKDPARHAFMCDVLPNGMQSERLTQSLYAYNKLLGDMEKALSVGDYLVGNCISLADYSLLPYIERLEQLQLAFWWQKKPNVTSWIERCRSTKAYQLGMKEWHNAAYIEQMSNKGGEAVAMVRSIVDHFD